MEHGDIESSVRFLDHANGAMQCGRKMDIANDNMLKGNAGYHVIVSFFGAYKWAPWMRTVVR